MSTEIILTEKAFLGIVLSSIEVYNNECLGVLLGYRTRGKIIVEYAIPLQSARRKKGEVEPNYKREGRVLNLLRDVIQIEKIGYYHSHTQDEDEKGIASLSSQDKKSMEEKEIELIVAINEAFRASFWRETSKGLTGTIGKYRFTMAAFYKRKDGRIRKFRIVCPYAVGFDVAFSE